MKSPVLIFIFSFACFLSCNAQENNSVNIESKLDSLIKAEMEIAKIPSIVLGIVYHDTVLIAKAYGHADIQNGTPATPETVYQRGDSLSADRAKPSSYPEYGPLHVTAPPNKHINLTWPGLPIASPLANPAYSAKLHL